MKFGCQVRAAVGGRLPVFYYEIKFINRPPTAVFSCIETAKVIKTVVGRNSPLFIFLPIKL